VLTKTPVGILRLWKKIRFDDRLGHYSCCDSGQLFQYSGIRTSLFCASELLVVVRQHDKKIDWWRLQSPPFGNRYVAGKGSHYISASMSLWMSC